MLLGRLDVFCLSVHIGLIILDAMKDDRANVGTVHEGV